MTASSVDASSVVAGFRALADPLRLQILETLRESELCVCDLCDRLNVNQSKLSFHLKTLREAGLVRARQEGRWMYYSLDLTQLVALEQYLSDYRRFATLQSAPRCC
ncbi:MAG: metalloregulator ArsR/SmtB family transcription factor [Cyanobacteria bacterium P01_A01_bin.3]